MASNWSTNELGIYLWWNSILSSSSHFEVWVKVWFTTTKDLSRLFTRLERFFIGLIRPITWRYIRSSTLASWNHTVKTWKTRNVGNLAELRYLLLHWPWKNRLKQLLIFIWFMAKAGTIRAHSSLSIGKERNQRRQRRRNMRTCGNFATSSILIVCCATSRSLPNQVWECVPPRKALY